MQINIDLGERSYPVIIGEALLTQLVDHIAPFIKADQLCIVSNDTIAPLYLDAVIAQLSPRYSVISVVLPDGERYKNLETLNLIYSALLEHGCNRDVTLIALGGGIVGDMTGFAAASFMRGVDFIQIPTTLLAQVDSSVGGKTGVNHVFGKNMIGAFYQPKCVLIDVNVLETLPQRELCAGLAEVIKYALILNKAFLSWLGDNMNKLLSLDKQALAYAIKMSCESKAYVVSRDEKEKGLRAILNLGHTFGHALEAYYQYRGLLHGEAVAIGMAMALELSRLMGNITDQECQLAIKLLQSAQLPTTTKEQIPLETLFAYMKVDKKAESGKIRLVLLETMGKAFVSDSFDMQLVKQAMLSRMPDEQES